MWCWLRGGKNTDRNKSHGWSEAKKTESIEHEIKIKALIKEVTMTPKAPTVCGAKTT